MAYTNVFVLFACCLKILGEQTKSIPVVCSTNITITDPREPNGYNNTAYVLVGEGEYRIFTCTSLYPNSEIKWYLGNVKKEAAQNSSPVGVTSTLSFDVTISLDNNELRCVTTDNGYEVSTSVFISVIEIPTIEIRGNVIEDKQSTFVCTSKARSPVLDFSWSLMGQSTPETTEQDGRYIMKDTLELTVSRSFHQRSLLCKVMHDALIEPLLVEKTIDVKFCPDEITIDCPGSVENGQMHTFSCQSTEGNPAPSLSWRLDGVNNLRRKTTTYANQNSTQFNGWLRTIKYSSLVSIDLNGKVLSCLASRYNMGLSCTNIRDTCVINVQYQPIIQTKGTVKAREGDKLLIMCRVDANPVANVTLAKNASLAVEIDQTFSISSVSRLDAGYYICRAINDIGESTKTVNVYINYSPTVTLPSVNITNATENSNITLICEVEAYPLPTIKWYNPNNTVMTNTSRITIGKNVTSDRFRPRIRSIVLITKVDATVDNGKFRCEATNFIGTENVTFGVTVEGPVIPSGSSGNVTTAVCLVFFAIIAIFVIAFFVIKRRRRPQHSAIQHKIGKGMSGQRDNMPNRVIEELKERNNATKPLDIQNASRPNSISDTVNKLEEPQVSKISHDAPYANVTANFAFPRTNLNITKKLGQGAFGKVLYAKITKNILINGETEAAVKTLKEGAPDSDKEALIQEIELMKILKPHPNVVRLLGCCTEADPIYMIVEYMGKGNIKSFLRKSRSKNKNAIYDNLYGNSTSLTLIQLMRFAKQVATGMEYLSLQKCIHRDLAARNVLLNDDLICKVSDFGLARDVMNVRVYQRKSEEFRLPLRWMALESLVDNVFTTESDVWSFGILLWEIITLGARPYPGTDTNDVVNGLKFGMRMPRPKHCPLEVYKIMQACWMAKAKDRPSFKTICEMLQDLLESELMQVAMERPEESLYKVTEISLANEKL